VRAAILRADGEPPSTEDVTTALTATELLRLGWHIDLDDSVGARSAAPSVAEDLRELPRVIVITAGNDPLIPDPDSGPTRGER
jgi:acetyl esterase/lipase